MTVRDLIQTSSHFRSEKRDLKSLEMAWAQVHTPLRELIVLQSLRCPILIWVAHLQGQIRLPKEETLTLLQGSMTMESDLIRTLNLSKLEKSVQKNLTIIWVLELMIPIEQIVSQSPR